MPEDDAPGRDRERDRLIADAAVLGIAVDPAWVASVQFHLALSLRQARLVAEFALPDEAEPAPVFVA